MRAQRNDSRYTVHPVWLSLHDPRLQEQFDAFTWSRPINKLSLHILFLYNLGSLPLFVCYACYGDKTPLSGHYGLPGLAFVCVVLAVHTLFFLVYYFETCVGTDHALPWVPALGKERPSKEVLGRVRAILVTAYYVVSPIGCCLAQHIKMQTPCAPTQISVGDVYVCSTRSSYPPRAPPP